MSGTKLPGADSSHSADDDRAPTVASLWVRSTEERRSPVKANSGCSCQPADRTICARLGRRWRSPQGPGRRRFLRWRTTTAGRRADPFRSVNGKRVSTQSPRESLLRLTPARHLRGCGTLENRGVASRTRARSATGEVLGGDHPRRSLKSKARGRLTHRRVRRS